MNRVIVQVPMTSELRKKAEDIAQAQGFSSLQDAIRMFLAKFVKKELVVTFEEPEERLSPKAERRYNKMVEDVRSGKVKPKSFTNVKEMMEYLNA